MTDEPRPKRRIQTQDERDLNALDRLRADRRRAAREERDRKSQGIPILRPADLDTGMTPRIEEDPALLALYTKIEHTRDTHAADVQRQADAILAVAGERPPEDRFAQLEKTAKRVKFLISVIAVPAISAMILVGKYLMTKSAADERALILREQQDELVKKHEQKILELGEAVRRLERERERRRDNEPDPPAKKDNP